MADGKLLPKPRRGILGHNIERFEQVTTEFIYSKAKSNLEMDTGDLTRNEWMISVIWAAWFSLQRRIRAVTRVSRACRLAGRGDKRDAISWQKGGARCRCLFGDSGLTYLEWDCHICVSSSREQWVRVCRGSSPERAWLWLDRVQFH